MYFRLWHTCTYMYTASTKTHPALCATTHVHVHCTYMYIYMYIYQRAVGSLTMFEFTSTINMHNYHTCNCRKLSRSLLHQTLWIWGGHSMYTCIYMYMHGLWDRLTRGNSSSSTCLGTRFVRCDRDRRKYFLTPGVAKNQPICYNQL